MTRDWLHPILSMLILASPMATAAKAPESFLVQVFQGDRPPQSDTIAGRSTRRRATIQRIRVIEDRWTTLEQRHWRQPRNWVLGVGPYGWTRVRPLEPGLQHHGLRIRLHRLNDLGVEVQLATWGETAVATRILAQPGRWVQIAGVERPPPDKTQVRRSTRGRDEVHIWLKLTSTTP